MAPPGRPGRPDRTGAVLAAILAAGLLATVGSAGPWAIGALSTTLVPTDRFRIVDETAAFGRIFHPGIVLGAAGNGTAVLAGGIGVYDKPSGWELPVVASLTPTPTGLVAANLTDAMDAEFRYGGPYALVWNGTAWMIGGQAAWGGGTEDAGTAASVTDGVIANVTPWIGSWFVGGGIFAVGWNGSAWLFGGNSSSGIAVVALEGTHATDLSREIRGYVPDGWVQTVHWNGVEWLLGGNGVFGTLAGGAYHDLYPGSPFEGNGVWAADWNGSAWIAGGGSGRIEIVQHDVARDGPAMPTPFDQAVLLVQSVAGGWVIGGKGSTATGGFAPALVFLTTNRPVPELRDLTSRLPRAFFGGEIQGGGPAPVFGATAVIFVGEGDYDNATGYGVGATGVLTVGPER